MIPAEGVCLGLCDLFKTHYVLETVHERDVVNSGRLITRDLSSGTSTSDLE